MKRTNVDARVGIPVPRVPCLLINSKLNLVIVIQKPDDCLQFAIPTLPVTSP